MHWAHEYIGKPWAAGEDGPCAFSCWGLMRHTYRAHDGIELPHVAVSDAGVVAEGNLAAVKAAARVSGFRRVRDGRPADGDFALMRRPLQLHCGRVVRANGRLGVLESAHASGVIWQPWAQAVAGFEVELWRRSP